MSEGPIKHWRDSHLPKRSVPQAEAVHLYEAVRNRAACGRKVSPGKIAFPPDGHVTCSDCLASVAADVEIRRQSDVHLQ